MYCQFELSVSQMLYYPSGNYSPSSQRRYETIKLLVCLCVCMCSVIDEGGPEVCGRKILHSTQQ
jgi:hypothetical protein